MARRLPARLDRHTGIDGTGRDLQKGKSADQHEQEIPFIDGAPQVRNAASRLRCACFQYFGIVHFHLCRQNHRLCTGRQKHQFAESDGSDYAHYPVAAYLHRCNEKHSGTENRTKNRRGPDLGILQTSADPASTIL